MTNPHPTTATDIDIRSSADQVIAQFRQGHHAEAMRLLEQARSDERPVVQEALDRYVSAGARPQVDQLNTSGALQGGPDQAALQRLRQASQPPRMPEYSQVADQPNELVGLTEAQKYDVYASMVETRGNQNARDALGTQDSVLLGLRKETSTLASMDSNGQRGTGVYDDQIAVLRKDANGGRHWYMADRASTEPTAQYDRHAEPPAQQQEQGRAQEPRQQQAPAGAAAAERHGMNQPGPFNDAHADQYLAAAMSGNSDALDRLAMNFAQSNEGQRMAQMGDDLLARQQAMDRQVAQPQHAPQEHARQ